MSNYTTARKLRFYDNLSESLLSENINSGELSSLIMQIRSRSIVSDDDIKYLRVLKEVYPDVNDFRDAIINLAEIDPRVEANTLAISILLTVVETLSQSVSNNYMKIEEIDDRVSTNTSAIAVNRSDLEAMANVIVENANNIIALRLDLTTLDEKVSHIEGNVNVIEAILHDLAGELAVVKDTVADHELRITKIEEEINNITTVNLGKINSYLDFKERMGDVIDHTTEEITVLKEIANSPYVGSCEGKGNTANLKTDGYLAKTQWTYSISIGIPDISQSFDVTFGYAEFVYNIIFNKDTGKFEVNSVEYEGVPILAFVGDGPINTRLLIYDATINFTTRRVHFDTKGEHVGGTYLGEGNKLAYRWIYKMIPTFNKINTCYYLHEDGLETRYSFGSVATYQRGMTGMALQSAEYEIAVIILKSDVKKEIVGLTGDIKENVMSRLLAGIVQVVSDSDLIKTKLTPLEEKVTISNTVNRVCPPVNFREHAYSWGTRYDNHETIDEMTESLVDKGLHLNWSEKIDSIMNVAILNARYGGSAWPALPIEIGASQTKMTIQGTGNYDGQNGEPITGNISADISENDLDMGWRIRRAVKSQKQELISTTWCENGGKCEMRWSRNYRRAIDKGYYRNNAGEYLQWYPQCSGPTGENQANALGRLCIKVTYTEVVTVYKNEEHLNISNVGGTIKLTLDGHEETQLAREMYVPNVSINMRTIGAVFEIEREAYAVIKPIISADIPHEEQMGIGNGCANGYALWKDYITMRELDGFELQMLDVKGLDMSVYESFIGAMGTTITPAFGSDGHPTYLDGGTIDLEYDPLVMSIHWFEVDKLENTVFSEQDFITKTGSNADVEIDITYDGQFDYAKREMSWNANWEEGDYSIQKMINTAIISQVGDDILQNEVTIANIVKNMKSTMHSISWKVILEHLSGALLSGLTGLPGLGTVLIEAAKTMKDIVESITQGFNEDTAYGMVMGIVTELLAALEVATKVNENIQGVISHVQKKSQQWQDRIDGFKQFLVNFNEDKVGTLAKGMMSTGIDFRTLGNDVIGTIESSIGLSDEGDLSKIITRVNKDMTTGVAKVTQKVLTISTPSASTKVEGTMLFTKEGGFTNYDLIELFSWNMTRGHIQSARLRQAINSYDEYTVQEYGKYMDGKLQGKTAVVVSEKHQETAITFGSDKEWW